MDGAMPTLPIAATTFERRLRHLSVVYVDRMTKFIVDLANLPHIEYSNKRHKIRLFLQQRDFKISA
jgi:hypothetical protein